MRMAVMAALLMAAQAQAVTVNFSFSSDLTDPQAANKVAGTVTGRIVGLTDNATSTAAAVYVDSYPAAALGTTADPSYDTPIDVAAWATVEENSFTLVNGAVTAAAFHSHENGVGGFDQFWLNIALGYVNGNTNYFDVGNGNARSIWNNLGLAGAGLAGSTAPEPASWLLMIAGFGLVGGALRRRAAVAIL